MTDIVDRLRYCVGNPSAWDHYDEGMSEKLRGAVDEIERLRAENEGLRRALDVVPGTPTAEHIEWARRALEPKP